MKAQFFSTEMAVVMIMFLMLFGSVLTMWRYKGQEFNDDLRKCMMEEKVSNMASILLSSPGNPQYWNPSNVSQIGICDDYYEINYEKLNNFLYLSEHNYSFVKELFGVAEYDYFFSLCSLNGSSILSFNAAAEGDTLFLWKTIVAMNNTNYIFKLGVIE